jgi:hypoxanthine-DNA glycosylase
VKNTERLQGLPPLVAKNTRLIILGSFPGVRSLQAQQYYAHPQNQFWRLIFEAFSASGRRIDCVSSYENNSNQLRQLGIGVWDVYASCERQGSLDSAIENAELNDLASLQTRCPQLQAIAHNGGESYRHAKHTQALGLPVYRLPSSSPANASWSFERKLAVWRQVIAAHCTMPV